jgi:hypothetical protein
VDRSKRKAPEKRPILLVTGGRDYADTARVDAVLSEIRPGLLIEGGARGLDTLVREWGERHGVHVCEIRALWDAHGKRAGPVRNGVMVELARRLGARLVAFPGGTGTADCVAKARAAGLDVTLA